MVGTFRDAGFEAETACPGLTVSCDGRMFHLTGTEPYTRKDGTYVAPHYRSSPNDTKMDNWSTRGNTNPYTGQPGTRDPYGNSYGTSPYGNNSYGSNPYGNNPYGTQGQQRRY